MHACRQAGTVDACMHACMHACAPCDTGAGERETRGKSEKGWMENGEKGSEERRREGERQIERGARRPEETARTLRDRKSVV